MVVQNLAAGTYYIEMSSSSTGHVGGAYTLSLQKGLPPGTPITLRQTLSGNPAVLWNMLRPPGDEFLDR